MNKKVYITLCLSLSISSCSSIRVENVTQLDKREIFDQIVVVSDPDTRESVLPVIVSHLTSKGYEVRTVQPYSEVNPSDYTLQYQAWWSWDLALYMSRAHIKMLHNDAVVGNVTYEGKGGLNTNKWGKADRRIEIMLDTLLGEISVPEANKRIQ